MSHTPSLPQAVKNSLWWQDIKKISPQKDKKMLIKNILQTGSLDAIRWMKNQYPIADIQEVFHNSYSSEYTPKTLNFWKHILGTSPQYASRIDRLNQAL